ncbi:hypothetical protein O7606_14420 [Micromonospora sp. WMMD882]|uniref:hypothetical protein n=1 Tax=Micromonospora sp. WMMD882 TaxID=3015151 RepID=UPI00248BC0AD|nr:hypothetical protein [Micromonospora sp. WMMD882]WBB77481.1 hypothetical protein O7606_14420 [Micromonospora sp. WMMD882]
MRDRKPTLHDRIAAELAAVRWPESAEIRRRARRRAWRQAAGAAATVLALAGGVTVVLGPSTTGAPPGSDVSLVSPPARVEIPPEALLQADDLPEPAAPPLTGSGLGEPVWTDPMLAVCLKEKGFQADWGWSLPNWSRSQTLLRAPAVRDQRALDGPEATDEGSEAVDEDPAPADLLLSQDIYRFDPVEAERFFVHLGRQVDPCAEWVSVGPVEWQGRTVDGAAAHRWTLTDRDFAGDESALLRHTVSQPWNQATGDPLGGGPGSTSTAIVRVGDLVTVIEPGRSIADEELRRLGQLAAVRMCRAANPAC